ncbi:MAG: ABC transporter ATP-binding protein [Candidatus Methanomethylophilus sp.]|nr:ABC transporter ATP-binding protein [Methanomethylophilus sp.]MDD4222471.1 ABC transporter ATP-binding protein [Methanomethylophilus sp.]MDD4668679.1 ABC transporter ATP-binding protein [Methanomethylophilus sp.]
MAPKITLDHISMKFGDFYAVHDISLDVEKGEYVTILGPSGCGKTTLIKVISGIWHPTEGRVLIDGEDVTDVPLEDRDMGYVFQNIALFPNLTNLANVEYGPRVRAWPPEEQRTTAEKYLKLVAMLDRAGMFPGELSGGEQQKVAIARALASGSKILMLDEPLSALDARVRMELRYEIRRIVKELGITVLHVTHDQEEAMSVSDRIVLMRAGRVHDTGAPLDIYRNPQSIFAAYFIGETNLLEGYVSGWTKNGRTKVRLRGGHTVRAEKSAFATGDAVVISVRPENVYTADDGLKAKVVSVVFMGTFWRVRTVAETGDYLEYNVSGNHVAPRPGDQVMLVFNKRMTKVFARPAEGLEGAISLE